MTWPIDDLTTTHLDGAGDDPSQAREELLAAVSKLKEMLGQAVKVGTVVISGTINIPADSYSQLGLLHSTAHRHYSLSVYSDEAEVVQGTTRHNVTDDSVVQGISAYIKRRPYMDSPAMDKDHLVIENRSSSARLVKYEIVVWE